VALPVLGAVGLGLFAVGVTTASGWNLIVPGILALILSLVGTWMIQRSRDRHLH
jgi:membrane protein implicated in regulation of membrane protease activity